MSDHIIEVRPGEMDANRRRMKEARALIGKNDELYMINQKAAEDWERHALEYVQNRADSQ